MKAKLSRLVIKRIAIGIVFGASLGSLLMLASLFSSNPMTVSTDNFNVHKLIEKEGDTPSRSNRSSSTTLINVIPFQNSEITDSTVTTSMIKLDVIKHIAPTNASSLVTTTTSLIPTTIDTLHTPIIVTPRTTTKVGVFMPGWTPEVPTNVYYIQTYVGACASALPHRLQYMGAQPIINIEIDQVIERVLDGSMDECWTNILSQAPRGSIVVPLAEANRGEVYHATPSQFKAAFAHIQALDPSSHTWCWAPDLGASIKGYAPDRYDLFCPSVYPWAAGPTPANIINAATGKSSKPVLIQQTGTTSNHAAWLTRVLELGDGKVIGVVYFNSGKYAFDWPTGEIA